MTYYKDLQKKEDTVYVGWLAYHRPFERGDVKPETLESLKLLPIDETTQTLGIHFCEFCKFSWRGIFNAVFKLPPLAYGSGVFMVPAGDITYCAPSLIIHYIKAHNYQPPREFLDAVTAETAKSY